MTLGASLALQVVQLTDGADLTSINEIKRQSRESEIFRSCLLRVGCLQTFVRRGYFVCCTSRDPPTERADPGPSAAASASGRAGVAPEPGNRAMPALTFLSLSVAAAPCLFLAAFPLCQVDRKSRKSKFGG